MGIHEDCTHLPHARCARRRCVWWQGPVTRGFRPQVPFQLWGPGILGPWGRWLYLSGLQFSPWTTQLICWGEDNTSLREHRGFPEKRSFSPSGLCWSLGLRALYLPSPQNCMNLPPDKVQLLSQYDNEKKWELICDQVGARRAQRPLLLLLENPVLRMQELAG